MKAVIGQEKLVKILDSYTLQTVPRTMLFLGPDGCGKGWISARFAEQLGLDWVEIKPDVTSEKLIEYFQCPIQRMYFINLKEFDERQQNKILKFIEEPSSNMCVILRAESEIGVLPTILNRCVKHAFEDYTPEQLKEFAWAIKCDDDRIYQICKTPGQLDKLPDDNLNQVFDLCSAIVSMLPAASYANTLSLATKIDFKGNAGKIDFDLFFDVLVYVAFDRYKSNKDDLSFEIYRYTAAQRAKAYNKAIAKESFMLNYLDNLWRLAH